MFSNHANLRPRDHYEKAGNFGLDTRDSIFVATLLADARFFIAAEGGGSLPVPASFGNRAKRTS